MANYPKVCVPKWPTDEQRDAAVTFALKENPKNRQEVVDKSGKLLALQVGRRWENGRAVHVRFLNGDATQRAKCEREAHKWEQSANVKFVFDNPAKADIRVAFKDGKTYTDEGSWSYIGTDCASIPQEQPSTYFGWLDSKTDDAEWQRVVVHEFGHALGAIHEDQQPAQNIKWDKAAVYKYFTGPPNNWTKEDVDANVLSPMGGDGIAHTDFDPTSIMAYPIPPEFTLDKKGVIGGNTLSDKDKAFIQTMYPFTQPSVPVPTIPLSAPPIQAVIDSAHPSNTFFLPITLAGTYRIWTSFLGSVVIVKSSDGRVLMQAVQQVVFDANVGTHTVIILPPKLGITANYLVIARRIR